MLNSLMTLTLVESPLGSGCGKSDEERLRGGEILLHTRAHSAWGGAVTAQMYLPLQRSQVWQQLTDYPRWVQYFPSLSRSELLSRVTAADGASRSYTRLYQVASKALFLFSAQVEIYLKAFETVHQTWQHIYFQLEKGSFHDFAAQLKLQDYQCGTLLTYAVQATPSIPVPTQLIQEGIRLDLPANMRKMRQVLCSSCSH